MAWIIGDGFDLYGATSDLSASGLWDAVITTTLFVNSTGRLGSSKSLQASISAQYPFLTKASGSNDAGHHICFAFNQLSAYPTVGSGRGLQFSLLDGTTHQCSFTMDANTGNILFYSGNLTTLLGTFTAALPFGSWTGIEVEIVVHSTAGSIKVRLNGNTTEDYTLTGVNTRGGTTNNYANKLQIGLPTAIVSGGNIKLDDLLWFSTSGASPNTWVGDIRCDTRHPTSTVSAGLTPSPNPVTNPAAMTGSATTINTNTLTSSGLVTTTVGGSLTAITIQFNATYTGHYRLAVYDGTTGSPTTLLAQTAEQTNAVVGLVTVNLVAPLTVAQGAKLFFAALSDATLNVNLNASTQGVAVAQTYASGFLSNISTAMTTGNRVAALGSITVDNYSDVSDAVSDGDSTFVYGATAGLNDMYGLAAGSSTPISIVGVQTRLQSRKSDTGTRQARIQVKSGGTTFNGTTYTMGTSYVYTNKLDLVDPATTAGWTASAVNSLQVGAYVVT